MKNLKNAINWKTLQFGIRKGELQNILIGNYNLSHTKYMMWQLFNTKINEIVFTNRKALASNNFRLNMKN